MKDVQPVASAVSWEAARRRLAGGMLSVIMPAHKLDHAIADNVLRVQSVFAGAGLPFEIVVIDDGSDDDTRAELDRIAPRVPELKALYHERNMGKGVALRRGFARSSGNYVLLLDADLDLPPEQVHRFFEIMEKDQADVVIGSKRHPDSVLDYPWHRRLTSTVYFALVKLIIGLPVRDTQTGIKLFKRETLEWAFPRMLVKQFAFDLELLAIINSKGYRITESPVTVDFHARFGCVRPKTVKQVLHDTLAIFYRLKIVKSYQKERSTRMPEPLPMVSVVVPYAKLSPYVEQCVDSVTRQSYRNWEMILLPDEPSTRTWPKGVREIPTGPVRPARKRNTGAEQAEGAIVAFIDDDAYASEEWMETALPHFSDTSVAAVGGPNLNPPDDSFMASLGGDVYANPLVSGTFRYRYTVQSVREVEDYPSCNLIVRKEVLKKLGGYRTDFWPGEDTFLCLEIVKKLGMKIMYEPRAEVYHHRRRLYVQHLKQIGRYAVHRGYFARKFPDTSRKLSYMVPSLFVMGLVTGGILSFFCPWCRLAYIAVLAFYAALTLLATFRTNPASWFLTWMGVFLTHVVYGTGFLVGLLTRKLPDEVELAPHNPA